MSGPRHFLDIDDLDPAALRDMLDRGVDAKQRLAAGGDLTLLAGKTLALIFEAPSTRTRVSFEVGMRKLGGHVVTLSLADSNMSRGESIADTARVLSRYVDAVMIRTKDHGRLLEMAEYADVPIINGLTDRSHPCQLMADVMTFEEHLGPIAGRVVAWSGEGNNMAVSWIHGAARFGFTLRMACPKDLGPPRKELDWAAANGGDIVVSDDLDAMIYGADCVVVDTWASMAGERGAVDPELLKPYQVDDRVMGLAKPEAIFMHCLPAYRGKEMTASVIDGPQSVVWDEAENRLHAQNGILLWCLS
ncbi:MAG: ornithine carbamoyltransferase [Proteobacteria bacterium]|nr:ornithine carbamoyltransferase [Pseudomonadota bacterium]